MPKSPKTLAAGAAFLLVLCSAAGPASATPREGQAPASGHESTLQQVAHNGAGQPATAGQHPEHFVRIAAFVWSKAEPADVMQADLTIESALPFALKEVEVACAQFARSGIEIDSSRRRIVENVPAQGRLSVRALDLGPIHPDAGSSGCRVVSVTPA